MEIERENAIEDLKKEFLKPDDVVYTVLRHVDDDGMIRHLSAFVIKNNEPLNITWKVAKAIKASYDQKHQSLIAEGCGLDVGFDVVYNLGLALFQKPRLLKHRWL